jgi:hypothetical protein
MDDATYRVWWPLHLRVARGERLNADDEATYSAGLSQLHDGEALPQEAESLRRTHEAIRLLDVKRAELEQRRKQLDAQIEALERMLSRPTRSLLEVGR